MSRIRIAAWIAASGCLIGVIAARAGEPSSTQIAQKYWHAFLDGNAAELGKCYAPRVMLKAGSELLKSDYGLNVTGDRKQDLEFDREQVIKAYRLLFERIGKSVWIERGKRLRDCRMTFVTQMDNPPLFEQFRCQPADLLVQVHTSPDDLYFAIRQDTAGHWWVVAECFD
ncbi:MAG: hypothetical protein JNG90_00505 [Planctomycetaceae bacterium]|nr:hypothetical protein [Planctomycetaceae bacterium]